MYRRLFLYFIGLVFILTPLHAVFARDWKPKPHVAAREYAILKHERTPTDQIIIYWFPAEAIPDTPGSAEAKKLLSDNLLIGTVRIKVDAQARVSVAEETAPILRTLGGETIRYIETHAVSPTVSGIVTVVEQMVSQAMGVVGKGIKWHVFDGSSVKSCKIGGFIVNFAGEDYDYKTPIPGCGDQV